MDGLELQTAVEKVEPLRAIDIHGGSQHLLREGFVDPEVCSAHGEMAERDLYMQRSCDHMADHDKGESSPSGGNGLVNHLVAKPVPEENVPGNLEPSVPPRRTLLWPLAYDKIFPAQAV